jgi:hypothetical protein
MHPSWRDMVIEFLVENREARQEFLRKCGVHGLLLALSTGGGKHGLRKFPLLIEPQDWSVFTESASNLISAQTVLEMRSLLKAVLDALRIEFNGTDHPVVARPPLRDLADRVLAACRAKWSREGWAIESTELAAFYQISEFLSPLPPSPDLTESWQRHRDEARSQMEEFDKFQSELVTYDIAEWLDWCSIVSRYEPRFLRQVRFPNEYEVHVEKFLPELDERAEWAPDFDSIDECDTELEVQDAIYDLATKISALLPQLDDVASGVANAAENTQKEVRVRKAILEERAGEESAEYVRDDEDSVPEDEENASTPASANRAKTVFLTVPPSAALPIDQLFDDL